MDKDNSWSRKEPIKATLQNVEVTIHSPKQEDETPPERKYILKVELTMVSGRKYILTAHGYYENEFKDFAEYFNKLERVLVCDSETLLNVNRVELMRRVRSDSFTSNPEPNRRYLYGNHFTLREVY